MVDINKKSEKYKKSFGEVLIGNTEDLEKFLCAYSYFITKTNKDYKYNLTYLQSYFDDFLKVKEKINEKRVMIELIETLLADEKFNVRIEEIRIIIDRFWILIRENGKNKKTDIQKVYTDSIDNDKIVSSKYTIEIQVRIGKDEKINITKRVSKETVKKEIRKSFEQLDKIIKKGN